MSARRGPCTHRTHQPDEVDRTGEARCGGMVVEPMHRAHGSLLVLSQISSRSHRARQVVFSDNA